MSFISAFRDRKKAASSAAASSASRLISSPFGALDQYRPLCADKRLYELLREAIPIIDAAINKIVRLMGSFSVCCENTEAQQILDELCRKVPIGSGQYGLLPFISTYLDSLLTYGNAVGEIVLNKEGDRIAAVLNHSVDQVVLCQKEDSLESTLCAVTAQGYAPILYPERILFSAAYVKDESGRGTSLLSGLEYTGGTLLKIYQSIASNFERVGNARFAVTYRPKNEESDPIANARIAEQIAKEWSSAMQSTRNGEIKDFIAVGDVDIRVIGADNQLPDTQVPVRQMLEQIVAKLGIPPFLLGLNWSTTERMSTQQADILTSELESYRRILTPMILKIAETQLRLCGYADSCQICWDTINLQDEVEKARAKLYQAQAQSLEAQQNGGEA